MTRGKRKLFNRPDNVFYFVAFRDVKAYEERLRSESASNFQRKYDTQLASMSRSLSSNDPLSHFKYQSKEYQNRIKALRSSLETDFKLGNISEADYSRITNQLKELDEQSSAVRIGFIL